MEVQVLAVTEGVVGACAALRKPWEEPGEEHASCGREPTVGSSGLFLELVANLHVTHLYPLALIFLSKQVWVWAWAAAWVWAWVWAWAWPPA